MLGGRNARVQSLRKDGRHARADRTRAAIVGALLDLADRGLLAPTAQQIADAAGVALRSIRQHFETRESLLLAAAQEYAHRSGPRSAPVERTLPLEARIVAFARARSSELESSAPLRRAAQLAEDGSPAVHKAMAATRHARRREIATLFEDVLGASPDADALLDAVDLLAGGVVYDTLGRDKRARLERMLRLVLRG